MRDREREREDWHSYKREKCWGRSGENVMMGNFAVTNECVIYRYLKKNPIEQDLSFNDWNESPSEQD